MSLSLYDGIMLAIVVFCVIQGAMKGMAWQLAPIASLVLGYLFGMPLSAATAPYFGQPPLNRIFSLITMYMLVSLGVYLIARSLRESIEKTKLVEFDRHLGALLGGVKGVLFTTVITIALVCVSETAAGLIVHSESRTIAENIITFVSPLLPKDVHEVIDPYLKPIRNLPDEPRPVVKDTSPFDAEDATRDTDDEFAPRSRRNQPIYEDDAVFGGLDDDRDERAAPRRRSPDESFDDEPPSRRRQRTGDETSARDSDAADEGDAFGSDPTQAFEDDEDAPRRR